ncbi:MAG: response regulator transcription factor [Pirellulaceae bacterium]
MHPPTTTLQLHDRIPATKSRMVPCQITVAISQRLLADGLRMLFQQTGFDAELESSLNGRHDGDLPFPGIPGVHTIIVTDWSTLQQRAGRTLNVANARDIAVLVPGTQMRQAAVMGLRQFGSVLNADISFRELLAAVNCIAQGDQYFDVVFRKLQKTRNKSWAPLTHRQLQIVKLVSRGDGNRRIADQLGLSIRTVENHRARIREKLGVRTSAEMVCTAKENGWI